MTCLVSFIGTLSAEERGALMGFFSFVTYVALGLGGALYGPVYDAYGFAATSLAATRVVWSGVAVALGLGLAAVLLLPMVELSTFSGRAESNWELYTAKAVPPWQMLTVVVPYAFGFWADNDLGVPYFGDGTAGENLAYVGVLPLALALASPFVLRARKAEARLWMMLALVAGILAVCAATPLGTLFYYAPGYARFRMPSRPRPCSDKLRSPNRSAAFSMTLNRPS